mgnify:CR=1 FL=1
MSNLKYTAILATDETSSFVVFQCAAAVMLGGAILAVCTSISVAFTGGGDGTETLAYSAALSAAICGIAYINYSSMAETRLRTLNQCRELISKPVKPAEPYMSDACANARHIDDYVITTLRYSDWLATFPLLALKLFELACDGPRERSTPLFLSPFIFPIVAGLGLAMVLCGFIALLASGDFEATRTDTTYSSVVRWFMYLVGSGCLVGIEIILWSTVAETNSFHAREVKLFSLVWVLYPVVFVAQIFKLPKGLKDIFFAILDITSKPLLAVYVTQTALKRAMS